MLSSAFRNELIAASQINPKVERGTCKLRNKVINEITERAIFVNPKAFHDAVVREAHKKAIIKKTKLESTT